MRIQRLLLGMTACVVLALGSCQRAAPRVLGDNDFWQVQVDDNVLLQWQVEGVSLHIRVSAPTTGWVGVGFDPESRMLGANLLVGWVDDDDLEAHVSDEYGHQTTAHQPDTAAGGTDDVTGVSGTQTAGLTELSFTIPLDSGDERDKPLAAGETHRFLVAYGLTDALTEEHAVSPYWFDEEI